jgi:hypothetical protein
VKAQRGVEIYLYCCFSLGAGREWVVNATPLPLDARGRDPVPVVPVDPTAGLDGCGKLRPTTGFRSLGRPARRETVYLKTHTKHKMQNVLMLELVVIVGSTYYSRSWSALSGLRLRQRTRSYIFMWSSWLIEAKDGQWILLFRRATTFVVATSGKHFLLGHTKHNIALLRLSLSSLRVCSGLTLTARTPCPCARHEDIWGRGGIVPLNLNLGASSRWLFSFTPRPLPPPPPRGKSPNTNWIGGWVGPRASLEALGGGLWR